MPVSQSAQSLNTFDTRRELHSQYLASNSYKVRIFLSLRIMSLINALYMCLLNCYAKVACVQVLFIHREVIICPPF